MTPSITEDQIFLALWTFLTEILPDGVDVILAQVNRVPEPSGENFVTMTPIRRPRLATNVDTLSSAVFTGSIAGTTLTVTNVRNGMIAVGQALFGSGVAASTRIDALAGGTGGVGDYTVNNAQVLASGTFGAGAMLLEQSTMVVIQLDVHGPAGADNAQVISTLVRDDFAVQRFAEIEGGVLSPLYADDPRQMPFTNENEQTENRWVIEAAFQANPVVGIPQQFADVVEVETVSVDAAFPP